MEVRISGEHIVDERPWGSWTMVCHHKEDGYKVKEIRVKPNQRLSYQYHEKRSEHWYVVKGIATVTLEDKEYIIQPGGHFDVPLRGKHRIANYGTEELVIVEVQTGEYIEEDDIIRIQDDYQRIG